MPSFDPTNEFDDEPSTFGRPKIYPYDEWFDGRVWYLIRGQEFLCTLGTMKALLYSQKKQRDCELAFVLDSVGDAILIQAYPKGTQKPMLPSLSNLRYQSNPDVPKCVVCGVALIAMSLIAGECMQLNEDYDLIRVHTEEEG